MDSVLPLLIERAAARRDRQAGSLRHAQAAVQQAQATLGRLQDFRVECLARSPVSTGVVTTTDALAGMQRFVGRLDEAIGVQADDTRARETLAAAGQQQLLQEQRRLMALEALVRRRATARNKRETRQQQRESDEFAARASRGGSR